MTDEQMRSIFATSFNENEKAFLFADPTFTDAVSKADTTPQSIKDLHAIGSYLLTYGGYIRPPDRTEEKS